MEKRDPLIGRQLGDFLVKERLGEGGFGSVYKATQITLSRPSAIKVLRTKHRENDSLIERFKREAYLASRLEHPYMAHIYSFGVEKDGLLWIAMEMVQGIPLDKWLKANGAMPLARFVPLFGKICEVVHTAHELGIIHRDIKPANIMIISRAGRLLPKLLDFGIAKDLSLENNSLKKVNNQIQNDELVLNNFLDTSTEIVPPKDKSSINQKNKIVESEENEQDTQVPTLVVNTLVAEDEDASSDAQPTPNKKNNLVKTEGIIGSPKYMAPELWENAIKADVRSDIYALGVTAYEVLTNEFPFKAVGATLMVEHFTRPVPSLGNIFPEKLDLVMAKAMAKNPNERYLTTLELAQDIVEASALNEQQYNLPQLDSLLLSEVLNFSPQPIAESVANLTEAKNAFQLRDSVLVVLHVVVRYIGLLALASNGSVKFTNKNSETVLEVIRKLRSSGLSEFEWIRFIQDLCSAFAKQKDIHPIPEIVALFFADDGFEQKHFADNLMVLLGLEQNRNIPTKEEQLSKDLEAALISLGIILNSVSFLKNYLLVIPENLPENELINSIQTGKKWMGLAKNNRSSINLKGHNLISERPVITDIDGTLILSLWPLMQIANPSPGQEKEIFFLECKGRYGAKLLSLPTGFEHEDENPWQWLKELFFADEEKNLSNLAEEQIPYPGLTAFKTKDANLFYGREKEIENVLNRLKLETFLAIVGPSGAGKSSFVQAGIVPSLGDSWQVITVRPGVSPLANLSARLGKEGINLDNLYFRSNIDALGNALRDYSRSNKVSILLVIDQFEELFTLCLDQKQRDIYTGYLVRAARSAEEPVRIIITLRDDFLIRVKSLPGLCNQITQNLELLATPQPRDLLRILIEPAKRLGYEFEDPNLPKEIVESVKNEASALPLLAFAAAKLWELRDRQFKQIRRKIYEAIGGIGGSLTQHAESVMAELSQNEQKLVREAFRRLVTSEGTRAILGRSDLQQLLGNKREADLVIEKLISARLLVASEGEGGVETIEVIHEALLSAWPRLVKWRQEDADGARLRDQLRVAALQWKERNRPKGLLWRDEALTEYKLWRERYKGNLTELEGEFALASLSEASLDQRIKRNLLIAAIAVLLIGSSLLFYQQYQTKQQLLQTLELYEEQGRREMDKENLDGAAVYLSQAYVNGSDNLSLKYMLSIALAKAENRLPIALLNHRDAILTAAFSPDDKKVVTGSADKTSRIWQAIDGKELLVLRGHQDTITSSQFSPDGTKVLTSSLDKTARIWKTEDGSLLAILTGHTSGLVTGLFSPDGKQIVTVSDDGVAKIWDSSDGRLLSTLRGHKGSIYKACYSKDGNLIATIGADKIARIWNSNDGQLKASLNAHQAAVVSADFSPDGKFLVTGSNDGTAKIWQLSDGKLLNILIKAEAGVTDSRFSPDGKDILITSNDGKAYICEARTGTLKNVLEGHKADIFGGSFSPDGTLIVTTSYDSTLRIWERATGKFLVSLTEHQGTVFVGAFANKGGKILSAGEDKIARIWQLEEEARPPIEVAKIVDQKVPLCLVDGRLVFKEQITGANLKEIKPFVDNRPIETETKPISQDQVLSAKHIENIGNNVEIEMLKVEAGEFEMGSPVTDKERSNNETLHKVKLSKSFYMGKYEVTQKQWRMVASLPMVRVSLRIEPSKFKGEDLPVEQVSWEEATEFCARLSKFTGKNYRLPTEAEWEYVARAGTKTSYPGNLDDIAWYDKNSEGKTHPVGQKKSNAWGFYDMHGNVFEWCFDFYENYSDKPVTDPVGMALGSYRVIRGGSWSYGASDCRSSERSYAPPNYKANILVGFRLVMTLSS